MTLQEFVDSFGDGHQAEFENVTPGQCMALMHLYERDVLGITDLLALAEPSAAQVFTKFPDVDGASNYTLVTNAPENVPTPGDLIFWNTNVGGGNGHVAVFFEGSTSEFKSFDCNWPEGSTPHLQDHDYTDVLGWLHPLVLDKTETPSEPAAPDPNAYPYGLDLSNPESVKVCVETWKEVTDGKFVRKEELDALQTKYDELEKTHQQVNEQLQALPAQVKQDFVQKIISFFESH